MEFFNKLLEDLKKTTNLIKTIKNQKADDYAAIWLQGLQSLMDEEHFYAKGINSLLNFLSDPNVNSWWKQIFLDFVFKYGAPNDLFLQKVLKMMWDGQNFESQKAFLESLINNCDHDEIYTGFKDVFDNNIEIKKLFDDIYLEEDKLVAIRNFLNKINLNKDPIVIYSALSTEVQLDDFLLDKNIWININCPSETISFECNRSFLSNEQEENYEDDDFETIILEVSSVLNIKIERDDDELLRMTFEMDKPCTVYYESSVKFVQNCKKLTISFTENIGQIKYFLMQLFAQKLRELGNSNNTDISSTVKIEISPASTVLLNDSTDDELDDPNNNSNKKSVRPNKEIVSAKFGITKLNKNSSPNPASRSQNASQPENSDTGYDTITSVDLTTSPSISDDSQDLVLTVNDENEHQNQSEETVSQKITDSNSSTTSETLFRRKLTTNDENELQDQSEENVSQKIASSNNSTKDDTLSRGKSTINDENELQDQNDENVSQKITNSNSSTKSETLPHRESTYDFSPQSQEPNTSKKGKKQRRRSTNKFSPESQESNTSKKGKKRQRSKSVDEVFLQSQESNTSKKGRKRQRRKSVCNDDNGPEFSETSFFSDSIESAQFTFTSSRIIKKANRFQYSTDFEIPECPTTPKRRFQRSKSLSASQERFQNRDILNESYISSNARRHTVDYASVPTGQTRIMRHINNTDHLVEEPPNRVFIVPVEETGLRQTLSIDHTSTRSQNFQSTAASNNVQDRSTQTPTEKEKPNPEKEIVEKIIQICKYHLTSLITRERIAFYQRMENYFKHLKNLEEKKASKK